ncbi:MAG: leucine-rich repeat protein [Clostridia bacterium]|nr:leucine-rich repeat protein [Clostridia bacterium]
MTRKTTRALALILALLLLCLPLGATAEEEEALLPFFNLQPVRAEGGRFWLETSNEWYVVDFSDVYGVPCVGITDAYYTQQRTCLVAQLEKGYDAALTRSQRSSVAGFYGQGQEVTAGRSTEGSKILEEFTVGELPAWRVEMVGQGYEMIWLRDGEDLYFMMYPTADADYAAQMRAAARTFTVIDSPNLAPAPEEDFRFSEQDGGAVIEAYLGDAAHVVVPDTLGGLPVRAIGDQAFYEAPVREVVLPEGLEEIGEYAFSGCNDLVRLHLPSTLKTIGPGAFESCMRLQWLNLEDTQVVVIDEGAFWFNMYLESLGLPATLETVGENNFVSCFYLERWDVAEGCIGYMSPDGEVLFTRDGKTLVHGSYYVGYDGPYAVPEGVEVLAPYAFNGCFCLEEIVLPASLREIGGMAFTYSGLTALRIPAGVTRLGYLSANEEESQTVIGFPNLVCRGAPGSAAEAYCAAVGMTFIAEE